MNRLDIVIFGATGYTGKFVVRELANAYKTERILWGIAGRSEKKLKEVLESIEKEINAELSSVEVIVAEFDNDESIKNMCDRAKLVINCVGPYRFFGEKIVKQCISSGTHHVDVSGEPEFLERMQLNFNQEALEKNVFIVGSCGFDSVPADLGLIFTRDNFKNDLSYIESFLSINFADAPASFNYATWESAVYGFGSAKTLGDIRRKLFKNRLPKSKYTPPKKVNSFGYFFDKSTGKYCMHFLGSDKSIVQRTQYFNYDVLDERPIQYAPYFTINGFTTVLMMIIGGLTFATLANYKFGRTLLLKYYKFFSFGLATKKETTIAEMKNMSFKMEFRGKGFDKKLANKNEEHQTNPTKEIVTEVSGPEPGYVSTARMIMYCALTILKEKNSIPVKGGVLTPASAFSKTTLIERLQKSGINFKVLKNEAI